MNREDAFFLVLMAFAPVFSLFLRGFVWGADSFAFWAVACGNTFYSSSVSPHSWFTVWLPFIDCNFLLLLGVMFFFSLLWIFGLFLIGKYFFSSDSWGVKFVLFNLAFTPLVFLELIRFENQFFSLALMFLVVGIALTHDLWVKKKTLLILCSVIAIFSAFLWIPSVFVALLVLFDNHFSKKTNILITLLIAATITIFFYQYAAYSFTQIVDQPTNLIAEEIPLIGLVFIIYIITFIKWVPQQFLPYSVFLLIVGLIKVKYTFLVVPMLIVGLINKEKEKGIYFRQDRIPLVPVAIICLIGLTLMSPFLYPTFEDMQEMERAIMIAEENDLMLKNDWGDGWTFISMGKWTPYKISSGYAADFNQTGFVAYTKQDLLDCNRLDKKTFVC